MGLYFSRQKLFLLIKWVHNDFMYVRFAGMRNTKTCSKSRDLCTQKATGLQSTGALDKIPMSGLLGH